MQFVQPGRERLLQPDKMVPRPKLAAMGMPRKLQVEASLQCCLSAAGLVSQQ